MARRKNPLEPPPIEIRQFTRSEIDRGIVKLRRRIEEVNGLDPRKILFNDAKIDIVEANIRESIREVFGSRSPEFDDHEHHRIWHGGYNMMESDSERQRKFADGIPQTVTMLEGLISRLEEKREDLESDLAPAIPPIAPLAGTRRVFIVHGRDEAAKEAVARFLTKLELEPIILHEQPNQGRTVIEKFEGSADVDFAVVLLTPDDIGYLADDFDNPKPRARQNVVFELGYFVGRLGRSRVCALHKGGVEILSDYEGVVYVSMDDPQGWRLLLAREIKAAGVNVDLNKAL
ncbi:MAG: nucleotide-binding protein [Pseudomonadota bacterium]